MSENISKVHHFLQQESVLILSTQDEQGCWSAPVLYVADTRQEPPLLYFLSSEKSRHILSLKNTNVAAVAIHSTYQYQWQSICGLQIQARITEVSDDEKAAVQALYFKRFPEVKALIDQPANEQEKRIGQAYARSGFYRATPSFLRFINNREGFSSRTEWHF